MDDRRYDRIRIADLLARAGVGKSTFYEHFRSKDDVLATVLQPVLLALVTAAAGKAARPFVRDTVAHLWARRSIGRLILGRTTGPMIQRRLADAIHRRLERTCGHVCAPTIAAAAISAAQIAMLRCWLNGDASCSIDAMTDRLIACGSLAGPTPAVRTAAHPAS